MLECKDVPFLINLYESFDFIKLEKEYDEHELLQMYRILKEDEIIESQDQQAI